jgi:hypothetical protein
MSQHDMDIANASGSAVRADINAAFLALVSQNSGATAPATAFAYQWWADTTTGLLKQRNAANSAWVSMFDMATGLPQAANNAVLNVAQTFTASQRTNETTDNDGSFDLNAAMDFKCTPSAGFTLTFTNIPATPVVQKGTILLVNPSAYSVAAHANTKVGAATLAALSAAGTYELAYRTSNGVAYVTASGALA